MSAARTIATLRKNNSAEVRVSLHRNDGYDLVDVRTFSVPRRGDGEPHPTAAGVCLPARQIPALIEALQAAQREVSR